MNFGILALQGDFERHRRQLNSIGASSILVRRPAELKAINALIIPGGESTTLLKLLDQDFRDQLENTVADGLPALATCAGTVLLANNVTNPEQESLGLIDIDIMRNAYGRQIDSFIESSLSLTEYGTECLKSGSSSGNTSDIEGVFIRAPRITRVGAKVKVLLEHQSDPVLVQQNNLFCATFHPELSSSGQVLYQHYIASCGLT